MTSTPLGQTELSPEEVRLAYHLFLGREPRPVELDQLKSNGTTLNRVRRVFLSSPEFVSRLKQFLSNHEVQIVRKFDPAAARRYVHLHIPKTAGTTMSAILATAIGHDRSVTVSENAQGPLGGRPASKLQGYRFIFGHLSYKALSYFPPDTQAICVLRRPGDRLLSFFHYIRRTADHPLNAILNRDDMSFGDFLDFVDADPRHRRGSDNVQMRIIAGMTEVEQLGNEAEIFQAAVSNLTSGRVMFGLTERLDTFQAWLKEIGLIKKISAARLNASEAPARLDSALDALTPAQREIYDRYVVWDDLLYEICDRIARHREAPFEPADPAPQQSIA